MQKRQNANRKKSKWDEIQIKLHQNTNAQNRTENCVTKRYAIELDGTVFDR